MHGILMGISGNSDVLDIKGGKIQLVDFDGREIWPNGPKNRSKGI
jgi:hypothetical protein